MLHLFIHTCTLRRRTEGAADAAGQPTLTWTDTAGVRCRRYQPGAGREAQGRTDVALADVVFDFLPDQAISEVDKIIDSEGTYEVRNVQPIFNGVGINHKKVFATYAK